MWERSGKQLSKGSAQIGLIHRKTVLPGGPKPKVRPCAGRGMQLQAEGTQRGALVQKSVQQLWEDLLVKGKRKRSGEDWKGRGDIAGADGHLVHLK